MKSNPWRVINFYSIFLMQGVNVLSRTHSNNSSSLGLLHVLYFTIETCTLVYVYAAIKINIMVKVHQTESNKIIPLEL